MENVLKSHLALCKDFLAFQRHFVSNYLFYCFIFHSNRLIFCFSSEKQIDKSSYFTSVGNNPCIVAEIFVACEYITSPCHTLRGSQCLPVPAIVWEGKSLPSFWILNTLWKNTGKHQCLQKDQWPGPGSEPVSPVTSSYCHQGSSHAFV